MKRKNIFGEYTEHKNPLSEKFAIPIIPTTVYQRRLKKQELCEHLEWDKVQTDKVHYRNVCRNCQKQFSSEVVESSLDKNEIMLN